MSYWLCKKLGTLGIDHDNPEDVPHDYWCNAHQSYECIEEFVPAHPDFRAVRDKQINSNIAAREMYKTVSDVCFELSKVLKSMREPRNYILGTLPPYIDLKEEEDDSTS